MWSGWPADLALSDAGVLAVRALPRAVVVGEAGRHRAAPHTPRVLRLQLAISNHNTTFNLNKQQEQTLNFKSSTYNDTKERSSIQRRGMCHNSRRTHGPEGSKAHLQQ